MNFFQLHSCLDSRDVIYGGVIDDTLADLKVDKEVGIVNKANIRVRQSQCLNRITNRISVLNHKGWYRHLWMFSPTHNL